MNGPLVSIVIPNWNGRELLRACLDSLGSQEYSHTEVVVVDNGSEDGSPDMVASEYPDVKLVRYPENRGFSAAVNEGIRVSSGELVALINNDAEADPRWISELVSAADRYPEAGSFATRMLFYRDRATVDTFGDAFTVAGFGYKRGWGEDGASFSEDLPVMGACGGAAMYRRDALEDVAVDGEYFDEDFFAFGEDLDISLRLRLRGHGCMAVHSAVVYHKLRATAGRGSVLSLRLSHRNFLLSVMKNFPTKIIARNLHNIAAYALMAALADSLKNFRLTYFLSYVDALRMWPAMKTKRSAIQGGARISEDEFESLLVREWYGTWLRLNRMNKEIAAKGL